MVIITGTNGRTIDVTFGWIKINDNMIRLIKAIPIKKELNDGDRICSKNTM